MPAYELTLIVKPLVKNDLVKVVTRCCNILFDNNAVVTKMESFGYKDLAWRMSKLKTNYFTGSHVSVACFLPIKEMPKCHSLIRAHNDVLHNFFTKITPDVELKECTLHEELKPPAYRKSVAEMRKNQRMCYFTRRNTGLTALFARRKKPISYPIAPPRD